MYSKKMTNCPFCNKKVKQVGLGPHKRWCKFRGTTSAAEPAPIIHDLSELVPQAEEAVNPRIKLPIVDIWWGQLNVYDKADVLATWLKSLGG